ncbi:hypothetical protein M3Y95_00827200 [Aphelenchoides besseyi]|nr:hypothetical protein M3Y95_00827200 [Aphelenchoides besseyi]
MNFDVENRNACMGEFQISNYSPTFSVDGRFLCSSNRDVLSGVTTLNIKDMFHSQDRDLVFDFSSATFEGRPKEISDFEVRNVFTLNIRMVVVYFVNLKSTAYDKYLGSGRTDFERSTIVVEQLILLDPDVGIEQWTFRPFIPTANNELLVMLFNRSTYVFCYLTVRIEADGRLEARELRELPDKTFYLGLIDDSIYGLLVNKNSDTRLSIDLVTTSISTGELSKSETKNCNLLFEDEFEYQSTIHIIGNKLFAYSFQRQNNKSRIFFLDTTTLEWKRTNRVFNGRVTSVQNDDKRTLIFCVENFNFRYPSRVYRFVFSEPDTLATLTWLRLKRIFDFQPMAYDYIIGQLPSNFKQKSPFTSL